MPTSKKKTPAFQRSTGLHMQKSGKLGRPITCSRCGLPFTRATSVSDGVGGVKHQDEQLCKMLLRRKRTFEGRTAADKYVADAKRAREDARASEEESKDE